MAEGSLLRLTNLVGRQGQHRGEHAGAAPDLVADLGRDPVRVVRVASSPRRGPQRPPLALHELLLARDVLDTRVYDVVGRRTVRVGEVWLHGSGNGGLVVLGLEPGLRPVLRRLGLRLSPPTEGALLQFEDVHLTSGRGHVVQLAVTSSSVHRLSAHELADLLTHLPVGTAADLMQRIPPERGAGAMRHLHPVVKAHLARAMNGSTPVRRIPRVRRTAGWRLHRPSGRQP
jgi:hypothetical protein